MREPCPNCRRLTSSAPEPCEECAAEIRRADRLYLDLEEEWVTLMVAPILTNEKETGRG